MTTTTALPTPSREELLALWPDRWIFPRDVDREHYMESQIYYRYGLDWRDPAQMAHVKKLVDPFRDKPRKFETND